MKDRIKQIIELENISYTKFADLLGIQRSGISHIINGRNKPSLEVIQKILEQFTYIDSDWLLFGKGTMKKETFVEKQGSLFDVNTSEIVDKKEVTEIREEIKPNSEENIDISPEKIKILPSPEDKKNEDLNISVKEEKFTAKKIERVLIFFSDKTLKDYSPEKE